MIICRHPKNGAIKKIYLEFSPDADLEECIRSAINLAKKFSDKLASCQVAFKFDGVELEVSEFSNIKDLSNRFATRRHVGVPNPISQTRA